MPHTIARLPVEPAPPPYEPLPPRPVRNCGTLGCGRVQSALVGFDVEADAVVYLGS
jgi:hypothetical protein